MHCTIKFNTPDQYLYVHYSKSQKINYNESFFKKYTVLDNKNI